MNRRRFLASAAGAAALAASTKFAAPALAQRAARTLRFVPHADLANFDPTWGTAVIVRNASALVYDMLYGFDAKLQPQRQMIEAEETSADGLVWTFRLREGLRFHDGEPVLARDAVASLKRWSQRDGAGMMIRAIEHELAALDDRSFRWVLKKPFPRLTSALGKIGTLAVVMPERIAKTDPYKQISEHVGSGPMRFVAAEQVSGARAVFERLADYVPRPEPASWLAGGKRMLFCSAAAEALGSSGSSCPIRAPPPRRCRTARSTGGSSRSPILRRCFGATATSRSTLPIRSATSAPSA